MNGREWIDAFAVRLGVEPPSAREWSELLDLAGTAAHASERVAAPVSCWVAARAGVTPERALAAARELAGEDAGER
jgi:DNA-binding transcriptional regulator YdaS (Cro superfamily)